tara:strand:+ start:1451 stop:2080 length:630 start_codon:yes stop_codon:yes gene_type:complete
MSTIKTTNITHGSNSGTSNLVLSSAGNVEARKVNGCQRIILEQFYTPCDGSVIALQDGNHTILNVTAKQTGTASEVLMNGSEISYTPPTGTTQVVYEYSFQIGHHDNDPIINYWLYVDSDPVAYSASTTRGHYYHCNRVVFKWAINIGGSASTNTGRQASWGSAKTLKMMFRCLDTANYEGDIHEAENFGPLSSADVFAQPTLGLTAIG